MRMDKVDRGMQMVVSADCRRAATAISFCALVRLEHPELTSARNSMYKFGRLLVVLTVT